MTFGPPHLAQVRRVLRFLVVDDDDSTVKGLTQLLIGDGHAVSPFTAGAQAIDALARESFDAVITGLEMPGVDGYAVARMARGSQPEACVVVVTAKAEEAANALAEAGACIVADKPLDYDELTRAVAACRAHGGPGAHGRCNIRLRPHGPALVPMCRR
jgi:DNA-binding response OmpR family regulator